MATQDNAPNKPVHLIYLVGVVVFFYILQWSIDWLWGAFVATPNDLYVSVASGLIAAGGGIALYKNDRMYHLANEVATAYTRNGTATVWSRRCAS